MSMLNRSKDLLEEFTPIEEEAEEVAEYSGEHPALLHLKQLKAQKEVEEDHLDRDFVEIDPFEQSEENDQSEENSEN